MINELPLGTRLPSRTSLCKRLDTNRRTLDKAINELCEVGVLYSIKGSGTFVNSLMKETEHRIENWGLILPNLEMPVFANIAVSVERYTSSRKIHLILCNSCEDLDKQEGYIRRLIKSPVSGIIVIPVINERTAARTNTYIKLLEDKMPVVFCCRTFTGCNWPVVMINNFYGGYIATKHLIKQGYQNIAFIAIHDHNEGRVTEERCQGYISALMEANIPINYQWIIFENKSEDNEITYARIRELLAKRDCGEMCEGAIDAVFGVNDETCRIIYQIISDCGLKVSDSVGVIGFDNVNYCGKMIPPLSSLTYDGKDIGFMASEILWGISHGECLRQDYKYYFCQPRLILRKSCLGPIVVGQG